MTVRKIINTTYDETQVWTLGSLGTMVKTFGVNRDGALEMSPISAPQVPPLPTGSNVNLYNYGGTLGVQDASHGFRALYFVGAPKNVLPVSSGTIAALEGYLYTNFGATGTVVFNLPIISASFGDTIEFAVVAGQYIQIVAQSGDFIVNGSLSSVSGGYFRNSAIGSILSLVSVAPNKWFVELISGIWLVDE
jgi:hypothetical protein